MTNLQPLSHNPDYAAANRQLAEFQAEIAKIDARIAALQAEMYLRSPEGRDAVQDGDASIEAAKRVMAGHDVADSDPPREIAQLRKRLAVLSKGSLAQREKRDRIRDQLSVAAAVKMVKRHRSRLFDILDAARTLSAAMEAERKVRLELIEAGYALPAHILPEPGLAAGAMLGEEAEFTSQISRFRRSLEEGKQ